MDIVGLLLKTLIDNQFVLDMTDCFSKLTKSVSAFKTTVSHIAPLLMEEWIVQYGIPTNVLQKTRHILPVNFSSASAPPSKPTLEEYGVPSPIKCITE